MCPILSIAKKEERKLLEEGGRMDNTILLYCVQFHIVEIYRVL